MQCYLPECMSQIFQVDSIIFRDGMRQIRQQRNTQLAQSTLGSFCLGPGRRNVAWNHSSAGITGPHPGTNLIDQFLWCYLRRLILTIYHKLWYSFLWCFSVFDTKIIIHYERLLLTKATNQCRRLSLVNSLWPSDTLWWQRSGSTLGQVMACCLTAPSHYLNQCWLIISKVLWHSSEGIIMRRCEDTNQ